MIYKFNKDPDNRWYIELQDWMDIGGSKEDLEMVAGADEFLNILSQGEDTILVYLDVEPFEDCETLHLLATDPDAIEQGAFYVLKEYKGIEYNHQMWLCAVTVFVFGGYPEKLYFK